MMNLNDFSYIISQSLRSLIARHTFSNGWSISFLEGLGASKFALQILAAQIKRRQRRQIAVLQRSAPYTVSQKRHIFSSNPWQKLDKPYQNFLLEFTLKKHSTQRGQARKCSQAWAIGYVQFSE